MTIIGAAAAAAAAVYLAASGLMQLRDQAVMKIRMRGGRTAAGVLAGFAVLYTELKNPTGSGWKAIWVTVFSMVLAVSCC